MRLFKNILPKLAIIYIITGIFVASFAYFLAQDDSSDANTMHLNIRTQKPGFTTYVLKERNEISSSHFFQKLWSGNTVFYKETPIQNNFRIENNMIHYQPLYQNTWLKAHQHDHITVELKKFWLGTDKYGRDVLSRIIVGARVSFSIGIVAVGISLIMGILLGSIAGYFGGWADQLITWFINITWAIPTILLVIAITVSLGKGLWQIYVAVGLTMWVEVARVVRGQIMSIKNQQYIEAAKVLGLSNTRIIIKHILPNIIGSIIVISASNFAAAILVESGLSFLGLGAQPPTPTWGMMIKNHYNYIITGKAFLAIIPGTLIVITVLSFMILSNYTRDLFDQYIKN